MGHDAFTSSSSPPGTALRRRGGIMGIPSGVQLTCLSCMSGARRLRFLCADTCQKLRSLPVSQKCSCPASLLGLDQRALEAAFPSGLALAASEQEVSSRSCTRAPTFRADPCLERSGHTGVPKAVAGLAGDGDGAHSQRELSLVHRAGAPRSAQPHGMSRCGHRARLDRGSDNNAMLLSLMTPAPTFLEP